MFTALVRVTGAGRLDDFRERFRWLMVRDPDAEDYTEHHGGGALEYRFTPRKGIPFPAFTAVSAEFPELQVEAQWERDGVSGRALIENGRVVQAPPALPTQALVDVEIDAQGRVVLALACAAEGVARIGYAASADEHTYFRFAHGRLELVAPESPDAALEEVALAFAAEWLWYDEEEAPVERARYANYGVPVRGANVKSEKLAALRAKGGRFSSLDAAASEARKALLAKWLSPTT